MMGVIELRDESLVILYGNSATSEAYPNHRIKNNSNKYRGGGSHDLVIDNLVDKNLLDKYRALYKVILPFLHSCIVVSLYLYVKN